MFFVCLSWQGQKWKNVWLTSRPIPQEKTFPPSEKERERQGKERWRERREKEITQSTKSVQTIQKRQQIGAQG